MIITKIIKKIKLSMNKLLFLLLLFSALLFANSEIPKKQTQLSQALSLISSMSDSIHALQEERGVSCGFVSSHGKDFKGKINAFIEKSDLENVALHHRLGEHDAFLQYVSDDEHQEIERSIENLPLLREDVAELKIDSSQTDSR